MKKEYIFTTIAIAIMAVSLIVVSVLGVTFGSAFLGGSSIRVSYSDTIEKNEISASLSTAIEDFDLRFIGEDYIIKTGFLEEQKRLEVIDALQNGRDDLTIKEYNTFGPSISADLIKRSIFALILSSILIIIFVAYAFKKVARPVSSWKYGVVALIALIHDAIVPLGVFSILAPLGAEVDVLFVMALLATIGYSVNDTLVIFDRIREHIKNAPEKAKRNKFNEYVDRGVKESYRRSIYTSLTTSIPLILLAVYVPAVSWFSVALLAGVVAGTYSSLFFAPSLLKLWNEKFGESDERGRTISHYEKAEQEMMDRLNSDV